MSTREALQTALDAAAAQTNRLFDRVTVLDEAGSTQDEARRLCEGRGGLIVAAARQTAGRGTQGRAWADTASKGLAITFVLDAQSRDQGSVSLAAGVAAAAGCRIAAVDGPHDRSIGLKWPNDIVCEHDGALRKLGGVLIEAHEKVLLVGIGVNVSQDSENFPAALRGRAISLKQLQCQTTIAELAAAVTSALSNALSFGNPDLVLRWKSLDKLTGRTARFIHDAIVYDGVVETIDPLVELKIRAANGVLVRLPARSTRVVHDG